MKQTNEKFVTYELWPEIYSIKDIAKAVDTKGDHEGTIKIDYDDLTKKIKLILMRFGLLFGTLRFEERSFLNTVLGFTPYRDDKPNKAIHADIPGI